jgi:type IV secretory pathway VirB3-like protein
MSSCIFPEGYFENYEIFGISALNIVMVIVFTATISKATKLPPWLVIVPVAFVLFKAFCLDTIFFNKEKTGVVSEVTSFIL